MITQVLVIAKGAELYVLLTSWFWLIVAFDLLTSTYLSCWCIIGIVSNYRSSKLSTYLRSGSSIAILLVVGCFITKQVFIIFPTIPSHLLLFSSSSFDKQQDGKEQQSNVLLMEDGPLIAQGPYPLMPKGG